MLVSSFEERASARDLLRPPAFRPAGLPSRILRVFDGHSVPQAAPARRRGISAARRAGELWEAKARSSLYELFGRHNIVFNPRFSFIDGDGRHRICEPDAIVSSANGPVIIEVKTIHTSRAFYQAVELYAPVIYGLDGRRPLCCEVVRSYDPSTSFPVLPKLYLEGEDFKRAVSTLSAPNFLVYRLKEG